MKKLKVILAAILVSLTFIGGEFYTAPQVCANRMEDQYTYKALNRMEGDWYNSDGTLVLSIHDGYINNCQVLGGYDFAGGSSRAKGVFLIAEADGNRYLTIEWNLPQYIEFNGETLYRG